MTAPAPNNIMMCLDETPRAAQTLRFVVENLVRQQEVINVVVMIPVSSTAKNITQRLLGFLKLIMEPYNNTVKLNLSIVQTDSPGQSMAELASKMRPRIVVIGPPTPLATSSFIDKHSGGRHSPSSPTTNSVPLLSIRSNAIGVKPPNTGVSHKIEGVLAEQIVANVPMDIPVVVARIPTYC
ncbi:hypothetical protein HDU76_007895 [Blyttiomyces sp. JEL0837]|nr:hypothetical protein HDU76_007895 [Blyttiomyces sp. JEL0837]